MVDDRLIWPPKMTRASGPRDVLQKQVAALREIQPELEPAVTSEGLGENGLDGTETRRIDLTVKVKGSQVVVATIEYPEVAPGYPALVITGDSPFWRYNHAYGPDELVDVLSHELSRDGRLTS